jgi:LuxR family quorum sensing-dependent transcriptional regulator
MVGRARAVGGHRGIPEGRGEATEFGIRSGFAVDCCCLSGREQAQLVTMAVYAGMTIQSGEDLDHNRLSDREREILLWAAAGKSAFETSQILGLSERTVKWHAHNAREAFGVATTIQAVVEAIRRRLIHP